MDHSDTRESDIVLSLTKDCQILLAMLRKDCRNVEFSVVDARRLFCQAEKLDSASQIGDMLNMLCDTPFVRNLGPGRYTQTKFGLV